MSDNFRPAGASLNILFLRLQLTLGAGDFLKVFQNASVIRVHIFEGSEAAEEERQPIGRHALMSAQVRVPDILRNQCQQGRRERALFRRCSLHGAAFLRVPN